MLNRAVLLLGVAFAIVTPALAENENRLINVSVKDFDADLYSDASYEAFIAYITKHGATQYLSDKDYYFALRYLPKIQALPTKVCSNQKTKSFWSNFSSFGKNDGEVAVLTIGATYQQTTDIGVPEANGNELPLLSIGKNINPTSHNGQPGCFLSVAPGVVYATHRYSGAQPSDYFDDIVIKPEIYKNSLPATATEADNILSAVDKITGVAAKVIAPVGLLQAAVDAAEATIEAGEGALQAITQAGPELSDVSGPITLKAIGTKSAGLSITFPDNPKLGELRVYVRRFASRILEHVPQKTVTAQGLLDLSLYGAQGTDRFITAYDAYLTKAGADIYTDIPTSGDGYADNLYKACDQLRGFVTDHESMSTFDGALVRWAALKSAGVLKLIADPKFVSDTQSKFSGPGADERKPNFPEICFSSADADLVNGVLGEPELAKQLEK